ncbi:hypothetical protein BCON_0954g00010 [Botryotinia convoluta]|uniref:Uncharacterized protein n=1 Tax=Botryotinia convoluta TaxID=54673 RepID=A0A4Z1H3N1_9HELO|nr:hypothetical protein BCON_0954g00010 [Botryotinia convoluta]
MSFAFTGIKRDANGAYYYNSDDIPQIQVPMAQQFSGNLNLTQPQLDYWFGVSQSLPSLPKYLVQPRLHSQWNLSKYDGWDITGEMIVYEPVEWIPIVTAVRSHPRSILEQTYTNESTSTTSSEIYGRIQAELEISSGINMFGVKAQAKISSEAKVEGRITSDDVSRIRTEGTLGDKVVKEVWLTMSLKVKPIFSRKIVLWNANKDEGYDVWWSGGPDWDDIRVLDKDVHRVEGLQFSNVPTSGPGPSNNIYFQVLPQLDTDKKIQDLHIAISNKNWKDWFAYIPDYSYNIPLEGTQVLTWRSWAPQVTLMALPDI